jgi:ribosomal protein S18 acetylase RimI-like enzyme
LAFSTLFQPDCVQQCAEVAEDDDDSFLAVFDSPQVAGGRSGAVHADPHRPWHHTAEGGDPLATPAVIIPPPPQKKGMVIHVHAPRKSLPTTGYDIQWKVDAPHPSGLVRAQARVMLERHESEYACSETGRSIEFHQDGERLEVARITCIRLKPQQLQRSSNTSWRAQYPAVAQYLSTINPPDTVGSVAASSGVGPPSAARFHALQHLLISDLHVHADYRGGGLGLSLLDHATRRAGDPLAWTVLTLPDALPHPHATQMGSTPPPSPQHVRHYPHDEPSDSDTLQRYFGLLGFAPIHERYMARAIAHRVLLPEASPMAPALGVTDDY